MVLAGCKQLEDFRFVLLVDVACELLGNLKSRTDGFAFKDIHVEAAHEGEDGAVEDLFALLDADDMADPFLHEHLASKLTVTRSQEDKLRLVRVLTGDQIPKGLLANKLSDYLLVLKQKEVAFILDLTVVLSHRAGIVGNAVA